MPKGPIASISTVSCPVLPGLCKDTTSVVLSFLRDHFSLLRFLNKEWSALSAEGASRFCSVPAARGDIAVLKWACARGCPYEWRTSVKGRPNQESVTTLAALHGHLHMLEWLADIGRIDRWNVCSNAASGGHLHVVKWGYGRGYYYHDVCVYAAQGGHVHVLDWYGVDRSDWILFTSSEAARNGHLDVLKWIHRNNYEFESHTMEYAARGGHLHVIDWMRNMMYPWRKDTCYYAAKHGHLELLEWLIKNGCVSTVTRGTRC